MAKNSLFKLMTSFEPFSQNLTREIIRSVINTVTEKHSAYTSKSNYLYQNLLIKQIVNLINQVPNTRDSLKGFKFHSYKQFYQPLFFQQQEHLDSKRIYKLGIITFILLSGSLPFENPDQDDPFYSLIFENNCYQFWQQHRRKRAEQFYSNNFRQFFQLCISKCQKISLRDLLDQDWLRAFSMNEELINEQYQQLIEQKQLKKSGNKKQQIKRQSEYNDALCQEPLRLRQWMQNERLMELFYQYKYKQQTIEEITKQQIEQQCFSFIVRESQAMAIPILIDYMETSKIEIQTVHEDVLGQQPYEMKCSSFKSLSKYKFAVHLQYTYGTSFQEIEKQIKLIVEVKKIFEDIVFVFEKQQGNIFYFGLFFNHVKDRFQYCLQQ